MERQPGYPQLLVQLIESHCSRTGAEDKSLRTLGAIMFKNLVKRCWVPPEDGDGKENALGADDKAAIKANMVHMMCIVPPEVQRQFSEALTIISKHDFPHDWPALLPDLVQRMRSNDYGVVLSVLVTANSILKRFRYGFKSDALMMELKYVLEHLAAPLTELLQQTSQAVAAAAGQPQQLATLFECLRLICRIYFSLNWQDLPEYFEDNMAIWMAEFGRYLAYDGPQPPEPTMENEPGALEKLQAAIVENINLYASKYDEEFQPHLAGFTTAIWALLVKVGPEQRHDALATTCIRFLTSIVSKQMHSALFAEEATLRQITENIVVPNLGLRDSDEELFEDNPSDYIQRDMEGSDSDTRRRVSCDLVRGMCRHHEAATTRICSELAGTLLARYASDPAQQWRCKDAALQLLLAVSVRAASAAHGVSETNQYVNVMEVFSSSVLPEISTPDVNTRPIVHADCIKFVATFRNQFTVEQMRALVPMLMAHLASEAAVVATYAAMAIEKLLLVKDRGAGAGGARVVQSRFGKAELQPFLGKLFEGLFGVLDNADMPENDYVMKAIMRALSTAQEAIVPVATEVLHKQAQYLAKVCANPANPQFNHYLFESIAVLVGRVCQADASTVDMFEAALFPPFQQVLAQDVVEFAPYVLQILAQLLELRPTVTGGASGFTPAYTALFPPLLSPVLWERRGNVPALVRLLQAYLRKDAAALANAGHLPAMLGVFQKLLATRATEEHAFALLSSIFTYSPVAALDPYLKDLFNLMLLRLQSHKTVKYVRHLTHFFALVAARHGAAFLARCLEACQPGLLGMILAQVWLPNFEQGLVLSSREEKVFCVGMTKLACESSTPISANSEVFAGLMRSVVAILSPEEQSRADKKKEGALEEPPPDAFEDEERGFDSTYSKLHFATTEAGQDPLPDVQDVPAFVARALAAACAAAPGQRLTVLQRALSPQQAAALQGFCAQAGASLV
ncbi:Cse1-domain-containing protein [Tribonema minus]|uniref:Cse1-domain-containing protein n=1 Tax=Tribonema minus TaxID=303371 RepID=A0A835YZE8_9STRA|nr:Cse1-domain-containing protein [Tribonema minus]